MLAIELVDGILYLVLNLGSGSLRLQATTSPIKDRHWHTVELGLMERRGKLTVDEEMTEFSTPGTSMTLDLGNVFQWIILKYRVDFPDDKIFIGGWSKGVQVKAQVWSRTLGRSFLGCLRDFHLNGRTLNLAQLAINRNLSHGRVVNGCIDTPVSQCSPKSCSSNGRCIEGWHRFKCDCSQVLKSGIFCEKGGANLEGSECYLVNSWFQNRQL